jgi:hypothetical protein
MKSMTREQARHFFSPISKMRRDTSAKRDSVLEAALS